MISVVIPTLNEEDHIGSLLRQLSDVEIVNEIIVVDGGSTDDTLRIIKAFSKARILIGEKGRARQMNLGAKEAKSDYLFFLHADSFLSEKLIEVLPQLASNDQTGSFRLRFDNHGLVLRLYSWFSKLNRSIFTYGDQGLVVGKSLFLQIEGFRDIPIMEDIDIVRRIKDNVKFEKFPQEIITSSRRFRKNGVIFQQALNILLVTGFYFKLKPEFLSRFYRY